ncbi:MAG: hypothetical protein VXZ96_02225 [Myxococcota bacterium]|nr:hypothetical protein [Myxococcota bacterium]
MQPVAIGYPQIRKTSLLQDGRVLEHRFELRKAAENDANVDLVLYVFSTGPDHQKPIVVVTRQAIKTESDSTLMMLYGHLGPEFHYHYGRLNPSDFLTEALTLAQSTLKSSNKQEGQLIYHPLSNYPIYTEGQIYDYGTLNEMSYEMIKVSRSSGLIPYKYLMYIYAARSSEPIFVVALEEAHSDRAFMVTSYLGKQWEQHGSHPELIVPKTFIEYSLNLAKIQLLNPTSVETANAANDNSPLQAYNYEDAHLNATLLTNQSYTRILFSLIIMCLSTVPYMLTEVAYVGGLFLGLFYVVFVLGAWVWLEGVRAQSWAWKSTIILPAMMPILMAYEGGFIVFALLASLLLMKLHRLLRETGLKVSWAGLSHHDASILKLRAQNQR